MFFVLSKILVYLILPLTIICVCFIFSLFSRNSRWKKRAMIMGVALLFFFTNDFLSNEVMTAWEIGPREISSMPKYKLAIVLTGATMDRQPNDRVYFSKGADRVTHTVQLYKLGLLEKILISGGSGRILGESEPEADKFKKAMVMMGVAEADIMIENETRNTAESAQEVKKILAARNYQGRDCLLITSAFHMRRSVACYRKAGVNLDSFSTDFYSHNRNYTLDSFIVPKIEALNIWHKLVKEWVGFAAYKAAGYL